MNLKYIQQFITILLDHAKRKLFFDSAVLDTANNHNLNLEIQVSLSECLYRLSDVYGATRMTNHQFLRIICLIIQQPQFQHSCTILNYISHTFRRFNSIIFQSRFA